MSRINTIKTYEGPSELDGQPIIMLITGLAKPTTNTKTGDMLQSWIMPRDVAPNVAIKTGQDVSVCGNCRMRPYLNKLNPDTDEDCYVKTWQAPLSTWKANRHLPVSPAEVVRALVAGRKVRRGSWGDPAAIPAYVWDIFTDNAGTGYTHQWRGAYLSSFAMASVHDATERAHARALGYRTFRVSSNASDILPGEILCPASKEAGELTQCADCNLCDGSRENDRRKDIVIPAH